MCGAYRHFWRLFPSDGPIRKLTSDLGLCTGLVPVCRLLESGRPSFWSLGRKEEQTGSRAEQGGERQNCYEFDGETEEASSSYFQFVPILLAV